MKNVEGRKSLATGVLGPRGRLPVRRLSASSQQTLELLRRQAKPVPLAALAQLAGLHPNTVRDHLDGLVSSGLVSRSREQPHGRGRPAWLYEATGVTSETVEYAGLASALATAVARSSPDSRVDARLAGEDWGRDLARQRGAAPAGPETARRHAIAILDDLGFAPRQDDPGGAAVVRLTRCPLLEAARLNPKIICNVHLGMLRGVLSEYGADPAGSDLVPFAEVGSCRLVVPPLPASQG